MFATLFPRAAGRRFSRGNSTFSPGPYFTSFLMFTPSLLSSLSPRSMDLSKFVLCFLILFNIPASDKGVGLLNNVASGSIISISTSKGNVIIGEGGQPISVNPIANPGSAAGTNRKWNHYETALSNTGPLGPDAVTTTTTTIETSSVPPPPTTNIPTTEDVEPSSVLDSSEVTKKPLNGRISGNRTTLQVNFDKGLLTNARKYIASYEDLQSRFPDGSPFENNTNFNMTVPLGDSAFLRCRVRNLGERSISWIRRRDWHILTTGKTTYTNDERFNVLHVDGTEDWTLQIKFVQKRDNGSYECQVSTGTGIISYIVNLFIAVPEAFILGNGEYHVEQGSNINLVCVIEKSPKPPEFIFWYHNERMINYGNTREVVVRTEPGARTHSRLTIKDARIADSGNYTCKTAHAEPASIFVYVSQASGLFSGDKMAAIQRRKTTGSTSSISTSPSESAAPVASSSAAAAVPFTTLTTLPSTSVLAIFLISSGVGASLLISSIQLSSSLIGYYCYTEEKQSNSNSRRVVERNSDNSNVVVISGENKISSNYCYATGNFLMSLFLRSGAAMSHAVVTTAQFLFSLLFFPLVLFLAVGIQITHFISEKFEPFMMISPSSWWSWSTEPREKGIEMDDPTTYHPHYFHHHHPAYCSSANNPSCSLQNSIEQQHCHKRNHSRKMLREMKHETEKVQQQQEWASEQFCTRKHNTRIPLCCRQWQQQLQFHRQNRHFVILARRKLLLLHNLNPDLVSSSSSPSSMKKSLPVFPSIAQSALWTQFSSGFPRFHEIVVKIVIKRTTYSLMLGRRMTREETEEESKERSHQSQRPLLLFHPSNRLGFRAISHLLIFPTTKGPLEH